MPSLLLLLTNVLHGEPIPLVHAAKDQLVKLDENVVLDLIDHGFGPTLKPENLKFGRDQLVTAHEWPAGALPALHKRATAGFLRFKLARVQVGTALGDRIRRTVDINPLNFALAECLWIGIQDIQRAPIIVVKVHRLDCQTEALP